MTRSAVTILDRPHRPLFADNLLAHNHALGGDSRTHQGTLPQRLAEIAPRDHPESYVTQDCKPQIEPTMPPSVPHRLDEQRAIRPPRQHAHLDAAAHLQTLKRPLVNTVF